MAGAKRMSAEEKRQAILSLYHKSKSVYTEKEILTLASKAGVNSNTVADINQSLIDDALVDKEKIGGSNYFWSFPAKKDRIMQVQHQQNVEALDNMRASVEEASAKLADSKRGREGDDGERPTKLLRLSKNAQDRQALQQEVETLKENDPQALADLEKELKLATEGANRWTDNIFNCKSYLTKKRGMDKKGACKTLGITSAFDYAEDKVPK